MPDCTHQDFAADVAVNRVGKDDKVDGLPDAFVADVRLVCKDCGVPFVFVGVAAGLSYYEPRISVGGTEVHLPVMPLGGPPPKPGLPGFHVVSFESPPDPRHDTFDGGGE